MIKDKCNVCGLLGKSVFLSLVLLVALPLSETRSSGEDVYPVETVSGSSVLVAAIPGEPAASVLIGFDEVIGGRVRVVHTDETTWTSLTDPLGRTIDLLASDRELGRWGSARRRSVVVPGNGPEEPEISGATEEYYLSASAPRGVYTLRFGLRPGTTSVGLASVSWRSESNIGMVANAGPRERPGRMPIRVHAGVFFNAEPVHNATVIATLRPVPAADVVGPPAPVRVIELRDDGAAPDLLAGDGTFVGDFVFEPSGPNYIATGKYTVRIESVGEVVVRGQGHATTVPFTRSAVHSVEVVGPGGPASLVRPVMPVDSVVDDEPDGLWNRISLAFPVVVNNPGEYRLAVRIQTAAGQSVLVEGLSSLQAGDQVAVAALQPSEIYRLGSAGPFAVKSVELFSMRDGESRLVDAEMDLSHDTQAYDIFAFQRPAFRPIGPTVFTPGDSTGPAAAPYSVLRAELPMIAAFSGHYEYVAQITAHDCAAPVAVARGNFEVLAQNVSAPLEAIRLNMSFDGMSIGTSGVDGPFTLRSLAIRGIGGPAGPGSPGPANSVSVRLAGRDASEFIPASAFVGFTQIADCNGNGVPDTCDLHQLQDVDLNLNGVLDACEVRGCNPADIADTDGNTVLTGGGPDGQLNNGDFSAFFAAYFSSTDCPSLYGNSLLCSAADIANTDGEVHPAWPGYGGPVGIGGGGPDGALDNGDFQAFFTYFFQGCGLSGPSGQGGIEGGGGELMSRILSLLGEGEESIGGINLGALPPAVIAQRIEMLRSLGRPITVEDLKAVAPELFAPPESPDR